MKSFALPLLAVVMLAGAAHAQDKAAPQPFPDEKPVAANPTEQPTVSSIPLAPPPKDTSHVKVVDYDDETVVHLEGCVNFQTTIMLSDDEHVQSIGLGDSSAWQVTPNKRGNLLFVKPITSFGFSNMTVVSDRHTYNFELRSAPSETCSTGSVIYTLRFNYGAPAATASKPSGPVDPDAFLPPPEKRNTAYTYSGAVGLVPVRVFDDGTSTYMRWAEGVTTPAVYALGTNGGESLVNYAARGHYLVVEQVAKGFVLRQGDQKVTLYNDTYHIEGLDAESPKPRKGGK